MVKCVSILGSTGSIGRQTLDIIDNLNIPVAALTAGSNAERMADQCRKYLPKLAVMSTEASAAQLKEMIADLPTAVMWGEEGLIAAATIPEADCVITAVVGMVGLKPTLAAIRAHKRIGLANKETLVCAGQLVMAEAKKQNAEIIPVDSEHSAIFQCLMGCGNRREVKRILLTCSGGPFYGKTREELGVVTKADALKHPNWSMGRKITIDSASLVNKGLEVIEAKWLFDVTLDQIQVLIQPQSILHSAVQFKDGAVIGQMGVPDMKLPIQYALFYPKRLPMRDNQIDFYTLGSMSFEKPDMESRIGGSMPSVFNAANEKAVALFLDNKIKFLQIYEIIKASMENHNVIENPTVAQILEAEAECYDFIQTKFL